MVKNNQHSEKIRNLLLPPNSTILNRFDYIDVGTNLRRQYMLPDDDDDMVIHPEPWQLQMLASLHARKSLVVVAPTSSGKTMSAEYAMRISANSRGDQIGVFILPTNALVRQAYATLCQDNYIPKGSIAMFTSERRDNFESRSFKVLVTNPQSLHLLIFSKGHNDGERSLYERIDCVVLDEAHCIGSSGNSSENGNDGSIVIERLLCMLLCPIVCLSATLANANEFLKWLQNIRDKNGVPNSNINTIELIEHNERSTALHYYSMAFRFNDEEPRIVDPKSRNEVGEYNLCCKFSNDTPCKLKGEWIITLPGFSPNESEFQSIITPQVMVGKLTLTFSSSLQFNEESKQYNLSSDSDHEKNITLFFKVRVFPRFQNSELGGLTYIEINGNSERGDYFQIDFNRNELKIPFQFIFNFSTNEVKFELFNPKVIDSIMNSKSFFLDEDHHLNCVNLYEFLFTTDNKPYSISSIQISLIGSNRRIEPSTSSKLNTISDIHAIDLNPLSFLPNLSSFDDESFTNFLSASPSLQPHHIVEMFDELHQQLHDLDTSLLINKNFFDQHLSDISKIIPEELIEVYQNFANDSFPQNDLQEYAAYRSRYRQYVTELHHIIESQKSLLHRIILDATMASIFNRKNLDWYGKLYFLEPIHVIHENQLNWNQEIQQTIQLFLSQSSDNNDDNNNINQPINPFELCINQCSNTLAFYNEVYLRNIFAMDSSIKYILSLLLRSGTYEEESTDVPKLLRRSIIDAIQKANKVRTESLTKTTSQHDSYTLEIFKVTSILKHFMETEETNPNVKEVQSPTLLFHFSKKGIDKMINGVLNEIDAWYKGRDEGHFLSPDDLKRIDSFPPNQISDTQRRALKYGIGMHCRVSKEGQDYLEEVEYLFQSRKLKFVFATSSLSYGINMPAANVIFLGSSPYLDGLMLRQCAGRAGRRGYGTGVGKVYFVGFSASSIIQKMCMPLDQLKPQLALSTSYILTSTVSHGTCHPNDSEWIYRLVMRTLTLPLYKYLINSSYLQEPFDRALAHSCLFSWGFLNKRGYLQPNGSPTMKCDLQYRIHYLDPYCFILTELLTECVDPTLSFSSKTLLDMIPDELLNDHHLSTKVQKENIETITNKFELDLLQLLVYTIGMSKTNRVKEASENLLHPVAQQIWRDYSTLVMRHFVDYLSTNGRNIRETYLPLGSPFFSYDYFNNNNTNTGNNFEHIFEWFQQNQIQTHPPLSRSGITALSGSGDEYENIREMVMSVKDGLFVSEQIIPSHDSSEFVHIRFEHVYLNKTFEGLKEKYQDVDAETSSESFLKAIKSVRSFLLKLMEKMNLYKVRESHEKKALFLFQSINRVITKYEHHLSIAQGLGEKQYGFVVKVDPRNIRVDPISKNVPQENENNIVKLRLDDDYESGDIVSYYQILKRGYIDYQHPEKIEPTISHWNEPRKGEITYLYPFGRLRKGHVRDLENKQVFVFYQFQVHSNSTFHVGDIVEFTTKFVNEIDDICIDFIESTI